MSKHKKEGFTGYIKEGNVHEKDRGRISERSETVCLAVKKKKKEKAEPFDLISEQKIHTQFVQSRIVSPTFFISQKARKSKGKRNTSETL